jgi:hypothetical protein
MAVGPYELCSIPSPSQHPPLGSLEGSSTPAQGFPHGATPCVHSSLAPRKKLQTSAPCSSSIYCTAALTSRGKPAGFLPPASRICSLHVSSLRGALAAARPDHISMAEHPPCSELLLFPRCAAPRRNAAVPAATASKSLRPALRSKKKTAALHKAPSIAPFRCAQGARRTVQQPRRLRALPACCFVRSEQHAVDAHRWVAVFAQPRRRRHSPPVRPRRSLFGSASTLFSYD